MTIKVVVSGSIDSCSEEACFNYIKKSLIMQELEHFRTIIDDIDSQLLCLLAKRQEVVKQVGKFKFKQNIPVLDQAREDYLYKYHQELSAKYNLSFDFIQDLFAMIMDYSRKTQKAIK